MHTRLRAASALLAAVLISPFAFGLASAAPAPPPAAAPIVRAAPLTDSQRGAAALRYVWAAQAADGSIDHSIGETSDFVIGAASLGFDPTTLVACSGKDALGFIATSSDAAASDAAKTGKAVLAVVAAGATPTAFHGRNLVARLDALYHASSGAYGDGSTFAQAFAILGLEAAKRPVPSAALAHLRSLQDGDGSWNFQKASNSTAGDSNSTAVALMALAAAGDHASDAKGLAYLHAQQMADGGFAYQNPSPYGAAISDPNSDGLVIQALVATGQDAATAAWSKGSKNALTHLRGSQAASGGFGYPGTAPNAFTTSPLEAALAGEPYAATVSWRTGSTVTRPPCTAPSPSPSPTAHPSATVRPTPAPSGGVAGSARPTPPATTTGPGKGGAGNDGWLVAGLALLGALSLVGTALLARRPPRR